MFSIAGIDLLEQELLNHERTLLEILLQDKTTKKNIIWATDDYAELGEPYSFKKEILPELVTGEQDSLIQPRVEKALEHQTNRTRDKAEVFTPSWICNAQNNLVDEQWFGGADVVLEVAGADTTFRLAWECARPNAVVTVVALYDKAQTLPLPEMYGKNLTFKTGGVDGCDCEETLRLIAEGKIDTEPLITHTYPLRRIAEGYELFEKKRDGVIKVAVEC